MPICTITSGGSAVFAASQPITLKATIAPWLAGIPQRTGFIGEVRFGLLNDAADWPAVAAMFTADARFVRPAGGDPVIGRDAILASFTSRPPRKSRHVITNVAIDLTGPDEATALSYLVNFRHDSRGDVVQVAGVTGTVEELSLRRTVLRDLSGTVHSVSNGNVRSSSNLTRFYARALVEVTVASILSPQFRFSHCVTFLAWARLIGRSSPRVISRSIQL